MRRRATVMLSRGAESASWSRIGLATRPRWAIRRLRYSTPAVRPPTPAVLAVSCVRYGLTALMLGELVADKLPKTPSRTEPGPFIGRIMTGGLSGAGLAAGAGRSLVAGIIVGALGGVAGTLGGYRA